MNISLENQNKRKHYIPVIFFSSCLLFSILMYLSPLISDDIEFVSMSFPNLSDVIHYSLYYGNGRLLGNISAISLSNSMLLRVVIKAVTISLIIILLPYVTHCKSLAAYILSFILIVAMPAPLFGEVFTWTSGFSNYVPPICLTLIILFIIEITGTKCPCGFWSIITLPIIFVIGVASQLYVEHSSIINLLLAGSIVVITIKEKKKITPVAVWFASTIIGIGIMAIIPKIFYVAGNRPEGYRTIHAGNLKEIIKTSFFHSIVLSRFWGKNFILMGALVAICMLLIYKNRNTLNTRTVKRLFAACLIWIGLYLLNANEEKGVFNLFTLLKCLIPIVVFVTVLMKCKKEEVKPVNYVMIILFVASLAPFLIVSPYPNRVILQPYIIIAAVVLLNCDCALSIIPTDFKALIKPGVVCLLVVSGISMVFVFMKIHNMDNERTAHVEDAISKHESTIEVFKIPYEYVFWDGVWGFYEYYCNEKPRDKEFIAIDYDEWVDKYIADSSGE